MNDYETDNVFVIGWCGCESDKLVTNILRKLLFDDGVDYQI